MKINELMHNYHPILRLWRAHSERREGASWTIFIDPSAFHKVYEDVLKNFAAEQQRDSTDQSIQRDFMFYKLDTKGRDDQYGLNSEYFSAAVLEMDTSGHVKYLNEMGNREVNVDTVRTAPLTKVEFLKLGVGRSFSIAVLDVLASRGLDGTSYGLQMNAASGTEFQIRWWEHGPAEWRELTTWTIETIEFLEEILNRHNRGNGTENT